MRPYHKEAIDDEASLPIDSFFVLEGLIIKRHFQWWNDPMREALSHKEGDITSFCLAKASTSSDLSEGQNDK